MKLRDELAAIRCISGDAFVSLAVQAYYATGRAILEDFKASGEPWMVEGMPWMGRSGFLWQLHHELTQRLSVVAARQRLTSPGNGTSELGWYELPEHRRAGFVPVLSGPPVNDLHPVPDACEATHSADVGAGESA